MVNNLLRFQGSDTSKMTPAARRLRLAKSSSVSAVTISIIEDLSKIRNTVTHGGDISRAEAVRFFELSQQVKSELRKAQPHS